MKTRGVLFAGMVVLALAGCDLPGGGSRLVGTLFLWTANVPGGAAFHVVAYSAGTTMDPFLPSDAAGSYALAPKAAEIEGSAPGTPSDLHSSITYQAEGIPAGTYSLFAWIDMNGDNSFDPGSDPFGFYWGDPGAYGGGQPPANVSVEKAGVVDADIRLDYWD